MSDADRYLQDVRSRMWEAAASDNGVTYMADGDDMVIHDPSIMPDGTAVLLNIGDVRYLPMRGRIGAS